MGERPVTLTMRQRNRSVLARQHLLERADIDIPTLLEHVGGLQTQYAPSGYVGLWSRLAGFERDALTRALEDRSVVQATLMRVTIHVVSAADYWGLAAGIRAARRAWWIRIARGRGLHDIPHEAIADLMRAELSDGPRRAADLIAAMERAGFAKALWEGAGLWVDMVRVPPSGTWERRRADLYALAEQWIPQATETSEEDGLRLALTRYLGGFGPASIADAASWAGVPKKSMSAVAETMELRSFTDEAGATLLDLVDGVLPDPSTPAPVRFLPTWDATLLVHCRSSGVLPEAHRAAIFTNKNPQSVGTVLVDGAVAATWAWRDEHVAVDELADVTARQRRAIAAEADRLTAFHRG